MYVIRIYHVEPHVTCHVICMAWSLAPGLIPRGVVHWRSENYRHQDRESIVIWHPILSRLRSCSWCSFLLPFPLWAFITVRVKGLPQSDPKWKFVRVGGALIQVAIHEIIGASGRWSRPNFIAELRVRVTVLVSQPYKGQLASSLISSLPTTHIAVDQLSVKMVCSSLRL
jgi:hypothetical protein